MAAPFPPLALVLALVLAEDDLFAEALRPAIGPLAAAFALTGLTSSSSCSSTTAVRTPSIFSAEMMPFSLADLDETGFPPMELEVRTRLASGLSGEPPGAPPEMDRFRDKGADEPGAAAEADAEEGGLPLESGPREAVLRNKKKT